MSIPSINSKHYAYIIGKMRSYCDKQGLTECYLNDIPSVLSACENIDTLATYYWDGIKYVCPQTSQLLLEIMALNDGKEKFKGYYNICNSFRAEKDISNIRYRTQFPLFEIEGPWNQSEMIQFQKGLIRELGILPWHGDDFPEINYADACEKYGVKEIGHDEEKRLCQDFNSPVVFLKDFYCSESYWNMRKEGDFCKKVDVIIGHPDVQPFETFGSAERSCNKDEMRQMFYTTSDGKYSKYLFDEFGKERVEKELNDYLNYDFFTRAGMGIGISRLVFACQSLGLLDHLDQ
jgi:aspartyl/asparaginyl-tRNA synthetase